MSELNGRRWLTIREASLFLGLSPKTLYRMISRNADLCGGPPPLARVTAGKKGIRLDGKELERRLERQAANGRRN